MNIVLPEYFDLPRPSSGEFHVTRKMVLGNYVLNIMCLAKEIFMTWEIPVG